jgi:hypothetical protein
MRTLTDPAAVLDAINQHLSRNAEYRLPAVLEVMGRHNDAMAAMVGAVDKLGDRDDAAAQRLRSFAAALEAEI